MQACVVLVATAALLFSSSVATAQSASAVGSSVGLFLRAATTSQRDCSGSAQAGGGEIAINVNVDNTTTGVNYTLYDPQTHQPLNAGNPTPTFAGNSNAEVTATIPVDLLDENAGSINLVVSDVSAYAPTNTLTLPYDACQGFTPYYKTAVTYSNITRTGDQCDKLNFDYAVVADRLPGTTRQFYIYDYSNTYASTVQDIVNATSSGGNSPGRNYSGSASVPVDSNFGPSNQETLFVRTPDPDLQDITLDAVDIPACTPVPPPPPPANNPPVAVNDTATTLSNTAVTTNVTSNDTDADGNTLSVTSVTQPTNGTASVSDASSVTYTPNTGFVGSDSYTYTISDGNGGTATATVTVTVNAPPPPPPPANNPPVAVLTTDVSGGESPQVVHASGAKSSDDLGVVKYQFVWGDGASSTLTTSAAAHSYTKPGRYTLSLTVYDASNACSKTSKIITITAPPGTPRVVSNETLATAKAALSRIHVRIGNTVYPRGYGATPPRGYKYVVSAFARQTHDSHGYHYYVLRAGQPIPKGSVVAILLKLVRR
jgi:hypothetical protein